MANPFNSFINLLKLGEDEYDDMDDDYEYDEDEYEKKRLAKIRERELLQEQKQREKMEKKERKAAMSSSSYDYDEELPKKERITRSFNDKIVPLSSGRGFEVSVLRPTSITDAQDACDMLLSGHAVIVNLEGNEMDRAQGIMDFISGCIYAIKGNMHQISKYIFIFSPSSIDISGDYMDIAVEEGISVPTLDEEF